MRRLRLPWYKRDVPSRPANTVASPRTDVLRYGDSPGFVRTVEPLIWYSGSGHEVRTGPHYYYDASTRGDLHHVVFQYTLAGCGFYRRRGGPRVLLTPGRAFIDSIPGPFEYGWAGDTPGADGVYEQLFVSLQGDTAVDWMKRITATHGHVLDFRDDPSVGETLRALVESLRTPTPAVLRDRYVVSGQLYGLLMQVLSVLGRSRVDAAPLVTHAFRLVDAHAHESAFNVARLARSLDCSREHLAREFRRATGVSPLDHLTRRRIRLAATELRSGTAAKLDLVARRAGFASAGYLCRVFRRHVGVTPAQFRERPWLVVP